MTLADAFPAYRPAMPIRAWEGIPADTERAEIHGQVVRDFAPLLGLGRLRALEATCDNPAQLAVIARLPGLEVLVLNHIGRGLEAIGGLSSLLALKLFAFGGTSLAGIEGLKGLRYLQIDHAPKLASLAPLDQLPQLEWLSIMTPPGWDAARRTIKVATLAPLAALRELRFLRLMGVEPQADGLAPFARLTRLEELAFSHVFTLSLADYASLAAALPHTAGDCLRPTYRPALRTVCKKCRETEQVWLTAPPSRARRALCPKCDAARLAAHIGAFERLKLPAARDPIA